MSGATRTIRQRLRYRQQMVAWFAATQSLFHECKCVRLQNSLFLFYQPDLHRQISTPRGNKRAIRRPG
jgi:hypothetical protein